MKVLISVPLDIPDKAEIICSYCGATLEVEPDDFEFHFEQREGEWFTCICGNCRGTIVINKNKYPFKNAVTYVYRGSHSR